MCVWSLLILANLARPLLWRMGWDGYLCRWQRRWCICKWAWWFDYGALQQTVVIGLRLWGCAPSEAKNHMASDPVNWSHHNCAASNSFVSFCLIVFGHRELNYTTLVELGWDAPEVSEAFLVAVTPPVSQFGKVANTRPSVCLIWPICEHVSLAIRDKWCVGCPVKAAFHHHFMIDLTSSIV